MIVIFSQSTDGTTTQVVKWIKAISDQKVLRINADLNSVKFIKFDEVSREFLVSKAGATYNLYDVKSYWYRKGGALYLHNINTRLPAYKGLQKGLINKLKSENNSINEFIKKFLESKCSTTLGSGFNATPNKLELLEMAKDYNLKTPLSFVISQKKELELKVKEYKELITKALSDGVYVFNKDYSFYSYTELVNENTLKNISDTFFPSLFQVKINKKFEVRSFYLDGQFYSMAIFSQNNEKTEIDFRKYDGSKPNRNVPYELPRIVKEKLVKMFNKLELNTCSVDLIIDENNEHVFLEINPVGQFSMVSIPCNYYLEKEVAKYLCYS
jgi:ATP-GRASP peptide maturase of grasp-with-spasm system